VTSFCLYDDATARTFEPFALSRPVGELRAGAELIRHRWMRTGLGACDGFVAAPHLAEFAEFDAPPAVRDAVSAGTWLVNSRCAPALSPAHGPAPAIGADVRVIRVGGRVAAVRLDQALPTGDLVGGARVLDTLATGAEVSIDGWWLDEVWDLIGQLPAMLAADCAALLPAVASAHALTTIGTYPAHVEAGATIEPFVVADTTAGPVLVRKGATVQSFTRLVGPCVIGEGSTILGGRVTGCSIGPMAKVCGEISTSIVIGHANKGHDGFVGHSVIGRWANLGAGTITSNLKNSYGEVALWTPTGVRGTGLQFLGALIGDHAKLGIGTRLTTGCVVGAGANVFGTRMPPKAIPPFAWGEGAPWETFALDRFLEVAERVMARRHIAMTEAMRTQWRAAFAARWAT
jgi:UDP-N-acetylglucosamine diphosphorylase/glucosamine-1-phosphate N-acetyltransferase